MTKPQRTFLQLLNTEIQDEESERGWEIQRAQEAILSTIRMLKQGLGENPVEQCKVLTENLDLLRNRAWKIGWNYDYTIISEEQPLRVSATSVVTTLLGANLLVCRAAQEFLEYITKEDPQAKWMLQCDWSECRRWFIPGKKRATYRYRPKEEKEYRESTLHFCCKNCSDSYHNTDEVRKREWYKAKIIKEAQARG